MTTPVWINEQDVLAIHERLIFLHGGASGIRDRNLLKSALARPLNFSVYDQQSDIFLLAATYTSGILQNHPFVDGNKRTGFVIGVLFLELNGYKFIANEEDSAQAIISLAEGSLDELGFRLFIEHNSIAT
ncbi:type II toxin-antitoxin system death-on-curing family toxin [Nitrosomonas europaea]|uniref:Putative death on curing protein n=1 Tax=Nitrosomonas europaea (strain ATCC 19718 / CIP 103999 / KCTC 2705 / NBRC 14298) TaxID=228410 RepID=Q82V40_NITEU|nr:type II toxin-antitoxin system death-on-curing family toxin [Nitrosomonas europaea]CAD85177.1 putative death on curing protein [Nitrosomonas europaea ATCC 19718]SDW99048.1 death on curing protein [Nitrosomonas europaea]SKA08223.1 death on curing protein [Nitrosomonas europaea]